MKTQPLLYTKINALPEQLQKEALDFIEFLLKKAKHMKLKSSSLKVKKNRKWGASKGIIKYMADDFDAPLEEFKEYMH